MYSTSSITLAKSLGLLSFFSSLQAYWSAGQRRKDINLIDFFDWLYPWAIPFLTEVEYQNKFLHFHWLLGMSGSLMGSWRKLQCFEGCFAEHFRESMLALPNFQTPTHKWSYIFSKSSWTSLVLNNSSSSLSPLSSNHAIFIIDQ